MERWQDDSPANAPTLAEGASARSRNVVTALQKHYSEDQSAKVLVKLLGLWKHREQDRNELVHGLFTVKSNSDGWVLINRTIAVKKKIATSREQMLTAAQAEAFRLAVTSERKALESALSQFNKFD